MRWMVAAVAAVMAIVAPTAAADSHYGTTIYRSTQEPLPGNLPSQAFQATQMSELGDEVTFAHHARRLKTVTVTMSSWGCQSGTWISMDCHTNSGAKFRWPITLNLYNATADTGS